MYDGTPSTSVVVHDRRFSRPSEPCGRRGGNAWFLAVLVGTMDGCSVLSPDALSAGEES
jgi:hypothetical protein